MSTPFFFLLSVAYCAKFCPFLLFRFIPPPNISLCFFSTAYLFCCCCCYLCIRYSLCCCCSSSTIFVYRICSGRSSIHSETRLRHLCAFIASQYTIYLFSCIHIPKTFASNRVISTEEKKIKYDIDVDDDISFVSFTNSCFYKSPK